MQVVEQRKAFKSNAVAGSGVECPGAAHCPNEAERDRAWRELDPRALMRYWKPMDQTPPRYGRRRIQGLFVFIAIFTAVGIVFAFTDRVQDFWIRPFTGVFFLIGIVLSIAHLRQSFAVRRHYSQSGRADGR